MVTRFPPRSSRPRGRLRILLASGAASLALAAGSVVPGNPLAPAPQEAHADGGGSTLTVAVAQSVDSLSPFLAQRLVWRRDYDAGAGSIAITPTGKTLYMPSGEQGGGYWYRVDPKTGVVRGSIEAGGGAHNTVMSLDGKYVYLAGTLHPYLAVASTATNRVVREIGPLVSGGRPGRHTR